jgi:uncharacterized protein involved in outer membrane biogenesis
MKPVTKKLMRTFLVAATLALAGVLFGIVPISAGFIRAPIENAVRNATGLDFSVGGSIILRLGPTPAVTTGSLTLGDPAANPLLTVDSLSVKVGLFPLLAGRIHLRQLSAVGARVDYCSQLPQMSSEPGEDTAALSLVVDQVDVENVSVRCGAAAQEGDLDIDIRHMSASAPEHKSMQLEADGSVSGIDVAVTMAGGELNALLKGPGSFPLDLSLTSDFAKIDVSGELLTPLASPTIKAEVALHSSDLRSLSSAFDVDLPALGALRAEGRIRANLEAVEVVDSLVELGESRISVDASADLTGERPYVELTAMLQQLDLAPFLDNSLAVQATAGDEEPADIDLRPVLDVLGEFDADLQVGIQRVLGTPIQLGIIEGRVKLADGIVDVRPLTMEISGAELSIDGRFDSGSACPELQFRARASELDLAVANQLLTLDEPVGGHVVSIGLETTSCGSQLFAHRDSLRAEAEILGGGISIGGNPLPLAVEQMHTSITYGERGRVRLVGELAGEPVQATLAVGSLEALLGQNTWPVEFDLQGAGARLLLDGRAGPLTDQFVMDAALQFDVPQIGTLHTWTTGPADAILPFRATSQLHFDENNYMADSIEIIFGESDLGGRLIWRHAQNPDILAVTLHSAYLDLDEVSAALVTTADEQDRVAQSDANADAQATPAGFKIPPVDLDLKFDLLNILELDFQRFDVSGRLRAGLIDDAKVSAILEDEVQLRGSLDLDLRSSRATGALNVAAGNVDVGELLSKLNLADDLQLRADDIEVSIRSDGATPRQLLLNASVQADLKGFNWTIPSAGMTSEPKPGQSHELSLAEVKLTAGPDRGTTWESQGEVAGIPMEIRLDMPSLEEAFGDAAELPLTMVLAAGNNVAMIDARIDRSVEQDLLAHVVMSGAVVTSENRVLAEFRSPLADYEISGDVALANGEWQLPNLTMRLGSSVVSGNLSLMSGGERRQTEINLHAPFLQTDDLLYWTTDFRAAAGVGDNQLSDEDQTSDDVKSDRGVLIILNEYISEFRESDDLELSIIVDELHAGSDRMGGAELHLLISEDEFILKPVRIKTLAGDVDAEYTWKHVGGSIDVGLKVHAGALDYGGLLRLIDPESQSRGVLYLDTDISAKFDWMPDIAAFELLLKNANGNFDLAAWPENADAGFLDLWTANLVLALLPQPTAEQSNVLNCLATRLEVEDGVLQTGTALLDSTTTIIRGRGKIDLAREELELLVAPQAKREKFLSMSTPVMVTGSFDDFQIGVEPAGMFGTVMKWWMNLIYVPFKWLTGERYPADGTATCFKAMEWELTPELDDYFLQLKKGDESE